MKKVIRLTEGDLHRIVKESVKRALNEYWQPYNYDLWDDNDYWPEPDDVKKSADSNDEQKPPRNNFFKKFGRKK